MRFTVFLDPIGEATEAPIVDLGDRTLMFFDEGFLSVIHSFGLLRRNILTRHNDVFIEGHFILFH